MSLVIRDLRPADIEAMVSVHRDAFPDYFSTAFGRSYLSLLYESYVAAPEGIAVGAFQDGRLAGFAAGHVNWNRHLSRVVNRHRFKLGAIACGKLLTSSGFRKGIRSRLSLVRFALVPFGRRKYKQANTACPNRLVSLAVHSEFRRRGVASLVVDGFCDRVVSLGGKVVGLSVFLENTGAIDFYLRTGWIVETKTDTALYFIRHLTP